MSEQNIDGWIKLCQKASIAEIHMAGWAQSRGHYEPNKKQFPNGLSGLKSVVEKIHTAGLRAGMHTLTGCINAIDPYITPVPDKRLATDASFTLAESIKDTTVDIPVVEKPPESLSHTDYNGRGVLRIEDELLLYGEIFDDSPYQFKQCERHAFGTNAKSYVKGANVYHLFVRFSHFFPDTDSTLIDEIATNIASVFNTCGFDMIYMDGAEAMPTTGTTVNEYLGWSVRWYGIAKIRAAIFSKLKGKGRVLVEASNWDYHSWSFHSRIGARDFPKWGLKQFTDLHCQDNEDFRSMSLLPALLGWWRILGSSVNHYAQLPDELEYLCTKALAYDMPMSFQGMQVSQPENARQEEYLTMIGNYERLRLVQYFSETVLAKLKKAGDEFHLVRATDGIWEFLPTDYRSHKVTELQGGSSTWTIHNRFNAQQLKLRIQALESAISYDDSSNQEIADLKKDDFSSDKSPGTEHGLDKKSGCYWAKRTSPQGTWTRISKVFSPTLDLKDCGALGVWILGDAKGEVVNFQLANPNYPAAFDDHYVTIDFTGWRYFELHLKERDADRYSNYSWPYPISKVPQAIMYGIYIDPLIHQGINELNIYYNNLPLGGEVVKCCIKPIKMMKIKTSHLDNPSISIGSKLLNFPVKLESGQYIEFNSLADCRMYDKSGKLIKNFIPQGQVPDLLAGDNTVSFSCNQAVTYNWRAKITTIIHDKPIRGMSFRGLIYYICEQLKKVWFLRT